MDVLFYVPLKFANESTRGTGNRPQHHQRGDATKENTQMPSSILVNETRKVFSPGRCFTCELFIAEEVKVIWLNL